MQDYQHKLLTNLDDIGFGVKYETRLSAYTPPHWHQAMELLLFVKGRVICNFNNSTLAVNIHGLGTFMQSLVICI